MSFNGGSSCGGASINNQSGTIGPHSNTSNNVCFNPSTTTQDMASNSLINVENIDMADYNSKLNFKDSSGNARGLNVNASGKLVFDNHQVIHSSVSGEGITNPMGENLNANNYGISSLLAINFQGGHTLKPISNDPDKALQYNFNEIVTFTGNSNGKYLDLQHTPLKDLTQIKFTNQPSSAQGLLLNGTHLNWNGEHVLTGDAPSVSGDLTWNANHDANQYKLLNVNEITLGTGVVSGAGYPQMQMTETAVKNLHELNFHGSNYYLTMSNDQLKWDNEPLLHAGTNPTISNDVGFNGRNINNIAGVYFGANGKAITTDSSSQLLWDGKAVIHEGSNANLSEDVSFNNKTIRDVFGVTFTSNPNTMLKDNGGNQLLWNDKIVTTSEWITPQDANNQPLTDTSYLTFTSGLGNQLTANSIGQLTWNGNVIGHHDNVSGNVFNPMQDNLDANNNNISDINKLFFNNLTSLYSTNNTTNGTSTLYFNGDVVNTTSNENGSVPIQKFIQQSNVPNVYGVQLLSPSGEEYMAGILGKATYATEEGFFNYTVTWHGGTQNKPDPITGLDVKFYMLASSYNMETDAVNVFLPANDTVVLGTALSGTYTSAGNVFRGTSTIPYSQWNAVIAEGKNYIYFCAVGTYKDGGGNTVGLTSAGMNVSITRSLVAPSAMPLFNISGSSHNVLTTSDDGVLMANNKEVDTSNVVSATVSGDTETVLGFFKPDNNTAGILTTTLFNQDSAYRNESFVQNISGNVQIQGELSHGIYNISGHTFDLDVMSGHVAYKVKGSENYLTSWKARYKYDKVDYLFETAPAPAPAPAPSERSAKISLDLINDISAVDENDNSISITSTGSWSFNNGVWFDNVSPATRYIRVNSTDADFSASQDFSISFWMAITSGQTFPGILSNGSSDHNTWRIYQSNGNLYFQLFDTNNSSNRLLITKTNNPLDNSWHHYVLWYNGTAGGTITDNYKLYIDGADSGVNASIQNTFTTSTDLTPTTPGRFGIVDQSMSNKFHGGLKYVKVYHVALNQQEISNLYNI